MNEEPSLTVPNWMITEALEEHLIQEHKAVREKMESSREKYDSVEWVNLLVKVHYIHHILERYGEYEDGQIRFET